MAEHTLLRKLEGLWGVPIFYADETGKNIQRLGVFSEKQNPLTVSEELRRSLICQAKEQNVPAICKIFGKIYFQRLANYIVETYIYIIFLYFQF